MNMPPTPSATHPIEARLFRAYWDDGLLDLFFGVGALSIGVCWTLGLVALGAVVPALLALLWSPVRRHLVEPHAGFVAFAAARVASSRRKLRGSVWLGVGVLVLFVLISLVVRRFGGGFLRNDVAALPAALVGVMACLFAAGLRIARFAAYGLLFGAAGLAAARAKLEPEVAILAAGAAVTLSGLVILARFLRAARAGEG